MFERGKNSRRHRRGSFGSIAVVVFVLTFLLAPLVGSVVTTGTAVGASAGADVRAPSNDTATRQERAAQQRHTTPTQAPIVNIPGLQFPTLVPTSVRMEPTAAPVEPTTIPDGQEELTPTEMPVTDEQPLDEGGTIYLNKFVCAPGTSPDLEYMTYYENCEAGGEGIPFTVTDGYHADAQRLGAEGWLEWTDLFAGEGTSIRLSEEIPDGYELPIVFCSGGGYGDDVTRVDAPGGTAELLYGEESFAIACDWFNLPVADDPATPAALKNVGNEVTITKYFCPAGTANDLSEQALLALCQPDVAPPPVTFTLVDNNGQHPLETDANGRVAWTDVVQLPQDAFQIVEHLPAGYGDPVTFCGTDDPRPNRVWLDGFMIVPPLPEPFIYPCNWFNIPLYDVSNTVSVDKWICPEGMPVSPDLQNYQDACTEAHAGIEFNLSLPSGFDTQKTTDANGHVEWTGLPLGTSELAEDIPDGFAAPVVFCNVSGTHDGVAFGGPVQLVVGEPGLVQIELGLPGSNFHCYWFNIPDPKDNRISVHKWLCPAGTAMNLSRQEYLTICNSKLDNITFILTTADGSFPQNTVDGDADWWDVSSGTFSLQEEIPADYVVPGVFCEGDGSITQIVAPTGYFQDELPADGGEQRVDCDWFNIPGEPGSIGIFKWTCPEDYDLNAWGADPTVDCTSEGPDGIRFNLDDPDPNALGRTDLTHPVLGGSGVYFGNLAPGTYTVEEEVPAGTGSVFVLECTGGKMGQLQPYPLSTGNVLDITLTAGDAIVCNWFNVPDKDPNDGSLTVYKYICTGEDLVSDVDCQIYEHGQGFDLIVWDGDSWEYVDSATTDGAGVIGWTGLIPGMYWLDEHDGDWCGIASTELAADKQSFLVNANEETTVKVYNCGETPGKPGDTPTKYPNTGIDPSLSGVSSGSGQVLAAQDDQVIEATGASTPEMAATPASRSLCLPDDAGGKCQRGAVPVSISIDAIGIEAPVEVLETVGGVMQQPSDEEHVAWYKETARLGEEGNIVFAGHLNWWGVPQAVFFSLGTLQPGDRIEIVDAEGSIYTYEVQWVRQESNLEPPTEEVLGMNDAESVTLITCGGEWDSSISEYDQRTIVRAVRVPMESEP